jgi:hypothetical protein
MDTDHMVQWRKASVFGVLETPGEQTPDAKASSRKFEAMIPNDIRHLERVEQYSLSKTQPERGCCQALRQVTVYSLARDEPSAQEVRR